MSGARVGPVAVDDGQWAIPAVCRPLRWVGLLALGI